MVNINTVYQRVLLLANKEQRGYITPEEFNSFADQAQREIFETYIAKKVEASAIPMTTDEYGDVAKIVEERLTYFDNVTTISDKITSAGSDQVFPYPTNFWSLGLVNVNGRMADEVGHRDLTYINLSPLTAPTAKQPVYTRHEGGVVVYPNTINSIDLVYLRKPTQPNWAYIIDPMVSTEPAWDEDNSTHFELNTAEEANLVYRILTLSGIAIKQQDIAGFGKSEEK